MARKRYDHSVDRRTAAELAAVADSYRDRQLEVTSAVYRAEPHDIPQLVGSCVLIAFAGARFLVTAGHVLDRRHTEELIIGLSPSFLGLAGDITRLFKSEGAGDGGDNVDVGLVRLEGPWLDLPEVHFATWAELDHHPPLAARHSYGIVGFPCSKNRGTIWDERMIATAYAVAGLEAPMSEYVATGHDPEIHVMLGFVKGQVWSADGKRTAPDLYGVSGSGLWRYGRQLRHAASAPLLSAIATEWHKGSRTQFILATRIGIIINTLAQRYRDVASFIAAKSAT